MPSSNPSESFTEDQAGVPNLMDTGLIFVLTILFAQIPKKGIFNILSIKRFICKNQYNIQAHHSTIHEYYEFKHNRNIINYFNKFVKQIAIFR